MGSKERREREKLATRQLILDAAREVFVQDGYDALSMRKIAEKIEYSATAIYVHFADKDALLTELSVCDFRDFTARFAAVPNVGTPLERLMALGRAYVKFGEEYPSQYRHLFMVQRTLSEEALAQKPEVGAYEILVFAVKAAIDSGALHPSWSDPEEVGQLLWSALHGVVALHLAHPVQGHVNLIPMARLADQMCEVLVQGMCQPRGARVSCCEATS